MLPLPVHDRPNGTWTEPLSQKPRAAASWGSLYTFCRHRVPIATPGGPHSVRRVQDPATAGFFLIIRGPLGAGKTAVARRLAKLLRAEYFSIDQILDAHGLWVEGRLKEFLGANRILIPKARRSLRNGRAVVVDGNFYWKTQIRDLAGRLDYPHAVFTLKLPLRTCILRDRARVPSHGARAAREVYEKSTRFQYGNEIDASGPLSQVVAAIQARVRAAVRVNRPADAMRTRPASRGPSSPRGRPANT